MGYENSLEDSKSQQFTPSSFKDNSIPRKESRRTSRLSRFKREDSLRCLFLQATRKQNAGRPPLTPHPPIRATTVTDDFGLRGQLQSEASNVEATAAQMRNILLNLQKACNLPEYDDLLMRGKEYLHQKQEEANNLIALYLTQHQADYATAHLMSSKITMLSHLVQKQAIENLDLNQRVVEAYEQADLSFEEAISGPIIASQTALNNEIARLLLDNNIKINNALTATKDAFNPYNYNTNDM
jgi:hypothetical protein